MDALDAVEAKLVQFDIDVKYEEMVAIREQIFGKIAVAQQNVEAELENDAVPRLSDPIEPRARFSLPDGMPITFTERPTVTATLRPVTVTYQCPAGCSERTGQHSL